VHHTVRRCRVTQQILSRKPDYATSLYASVRKSIDLRARDDAQSSPAAIA